MPPSSTVSYVLYFYRKFTSNGNLSNQLLFQPRKGVETTPMKERLPGNRNSWCCAREGDLPNRLQGVGTLSEGMSVAAAPAWSVGPFYAMNSWTTRNASLECAFFKYLVSTCWWGACIVRLRLCWLWACRRVATVNGHLLPACGHLGVEDIGAGTSVATPAQLSPRKYVHSLLLAGYFPINFLQLP